MPPRRKKESKVEGSSEKPLIMKPTGRARCYGFASDGHRCCRLIEGDDNVQISWRTPPSEDHPKGRSFNAHMCCFVKLPDFGVVKPFQEWPVEESRMRDGGEEKKVGAATPATVTLAKVTFNAYKPASLPDAVIFDPSPPPALAPFVAEAPPGRPEGGDMSVAYMLSVELARGNSQGIPAETEVELVFGDDEYPQSVSYACRGHHIRYVVWRHCGVLWRLHEAPGYELQAFTTDSMMLNVKVKMLPSEGLEGFSDEDLEALRTWLECYGPGYSGIKFVDPNAPPPPPQDGVDQMSVPMLKAELRKLKEAGVKVDDKLVTITGNQDELKARLRAARRVVQIEEENAVWFGPDPVAAAAAGMISAAAPAPAQPDGGDVAPAPAAPAPAPQGDALVALTGAAAAAEQGAHAQSGVIEIDGDDEAPAVSSAAQAANDGDDEAQPSPKRARVAAAADDSDGDD